MGVNVSGEELHEALMLKRVLKGNNRHKLGKFRVRRWEIKGSEIGQWMKGIRKTDYAVDTSTTQRLNIR